MTPSAKFPPRRPGSPGASIASFKGGVRLLALGAASAVILAGCNADYTPTGQVEGNDYHNVHPIVLAHAPTSLDVFPVGAGLDTVGRGELRAFVDRYRRFGAGPILIMAPAGRSGLTQVAVTQIRKALAADGVRGNVNIGSYPPSSEAAASPIRLTFIGLKAGVRTRCGQWPKDLASGVGSDEWQNANYWNYGCATQAMFAAQLDDPRDLEQARALEEADVQMRTRAIGDVRQGADPGTAWATGVTSIGGI